MFHDVSWVSFRLRTWRGASNPPHPAKYFETSHDIQLPWNRENLAFWNFKKNEEQTVISGPKTLRTAAMIGSLRETPPGVLREESDCLLRLCLKKSSAYGFSPDLSALLQVLCFAAPWLESLGFPKRLWVDVAFLGIRSP